MTRREAPIPRSRCCFRFIDLHTVPRAERLNALTLRLAQHSPFSEANHCAVIVKQGAMTWSWASATGSATALPIAIWQPKPIKPLIRLVKHDDGFEAQQWQEGHLRASQFWSSAPNEAAWQRFCRGIGLSEVPPLPEATSLPLLKPWAKNHLRQQLQNAKRQQQLLWTGVGLLGIFFSEALWTAVATYRQVNQLAEQVDEQRRRAQATLVVKQEAQQNHAVAQQLLALQPPRQLPLLMTVFQQLPPLNTPRIVSWEAIGDRLNVTISVLNPDPQQFVERFQTHPRFDQVSAQSGPLEGQLSLQMQVIR